MPTQPKPPTTPPARPGPMQVPPRKPLPQPAPVPWTPGGAPRQQPQTAPPPPPPQTLPPRPVGPNMPPAQPPHPAPRSDGSPNSGFNPAPAGGGLDYAPWFGGRSDLFGPGASDPGAQAASSYIGQQLGAGDTPFGQSPGIEAAGAKTSGQDIQDDPAIAAARRNYELNDLPALQNQAALAGLGNSSSLVNADARARAAMLTPLYEDAMQREAARNSQVYNATESELGRRERASGRAADATQAMIDRLMGLSGQQYGQTQGGIQTGMDIGGVLRGITQSGNEANYQDFLRQQALGEESLFSPFGQMIPSALGSRTTMSGK